MSEMYKTEEFKDCIKKSREDSFKGWVGEDNQVGLDIVLNKYAQPDEDFNNWVKRVSGGDEDVAKLIKEKKFLFAGRTMANRGLGGKESLSNCYSRGFVEDNMTDIMQTCTDLAMTYKAQGGQGISLSKLRPKGTPIGGKYESDGIIPFMTLYNEITGSISQGGARRGALIIGLDIMHKEAEQFIEIKGNTDKITNANLSLEISNDFMSIVSRDYRLKNKSSLTVTRYYGENNEHKVEYVICPIDLFKKMCEFAWDWGEPGCIFTDEFRKYNFMEHIEDYQIEICNPCGEQPLPKNLSCNLGSLNLYEFVDNKFGNSEFNFIEFGEAVKIATKALDGIIDENAENHPLEEQRKLVKKWRNLGLGVFGYADMLAAMEMTYGSSEALDLTESIFEKMLDNSVAASIELAKENGSIFTDEELVQICNSEIADSFLGSDIRSDIKKHGLRNATFLSIAPTGSISTMLGRSGGIEPIFALSHTRKTENLKESYEVYCETFKDFMRLTPYDLFGIPPYFITATEIDTGDRLRTQQIVQRRVDTAISSTINLPNTATVEDVMQLYIKAWELDLKGVTVFRDGCKRSPILKDMKDKITTLDDITPTPVNTPISNEISDNDTLPRGYIINANDDLSGRSKAIYTGCGKIYLDLKYDEYDCMPYETFINKGSGGGCERNYQFISRLMSLCLRLGGTIEDIIDQAKSVSPCTAYVAANCTSKGSSCPNAIGYALDGMYKDIKSKHIEQEDCCVEPTIQKNAHQSTQEKYNCPTCNEPLRYEGGCDICHGCGYTKCD